MSDRPIAQQRRIAIALFRRWINEEARWLTLSNPKTGETELIEAECLEEEGFREAIDRELAWQLYLQRGRDYLISSVPRLHFEYTRYQQGSSGESLSIAETVEFFLVELFGETGLETLDQQDRVGWQTVGDLLSPPPRGCRLRAGQRDLLVLTDVLSGCLP